MGNFKLSVIHRLPQNYRWLTGHIGKKIEVMPDNISSSKSNILIGFKVLCYEISDNLAVLKHLSSALDEIQIANDLLEWQGQICLFIRYEDEGLATCHFKTAGVAIAESITLPARPYSH
ncbi:MULTISPECIES: hypothetical protein [Arsenophonus]|uniref:hypothetical protein n=1 Tax=Arsenophonus TaxID=637 RepID=UPI0015D7A4B0|nr:MULTISPECIES: hypothetical protein [Arsenophonus]UBX30126.1 hypothetical protein LDL57_05820 [Arsenophonus apicola]